jgi:hypothetical protein
MFKMQKQCKKMGLKHATQRQANMTNANKMQIEKYKCQDLAQSNIMIYVWNGILTYIIP